MYNFYRDLIFPVCKTSNREGPTCMDCFVNFFYRCQLFLCCCFFTFFNNFNSFGVPVGSPSRGGDIAVYVWHKPTKLACSLFCSCVCFWLYGPFSCSSFCTFSQQLIIFSLCSSGLMSAFLVLSTRYLFMKVSFSPDIIPTGLLGSQHKLTNYSLMKVSFSPDIIPNGWLGLKHQLTNYSLMKVSFSPDIIPNGWLG